MTETAGTLVLVCGQYNWFQCSYCGRERPTTVYSGTSQGEWSLIAGRSEHRGSIGLGMWAIQPFSKVPLPNWPADSKPPKLRGKIVTNTRKFQV